MWTELLILGRITFMSVAVCFKWFCLVVETETWNLESHRPNIQAFNIHFSLKRFEQEPLVWEEAGWNRLMGLPIKCWVNVPPIFQNHWLDSWKYFVLLFKLRFCSQTMFIKDDALVVFFQEVVWYILLTPLMANLQSCANYVFKRKGNVKTLFSWPQMAEQDKPFDLQRKLFLPSVSVSGSIRWR